MSTSAPSPRPARSRTANNIGWILFTLVAVAALFGSGVAVAEYLLSYTPDPRVEEHKFTRVGYFGGSMAIFGPWIVMVLSAFVMGRLQRRPRLTWVIPIIALALVITLWYLGLKIALLW